MILCIRIKIFVYEKKFHVSFLFRLYSLKILSFYIRKIYQEDIIHKIFLLFVEKNCFYKK